MKIIQKIVRVLFISYFFLQVSVPVYGMFSEECEPKLVEKFELTKDFTIQFTARAFKPENENILAVGWNEFTFFGALDIWDLKSKKVIGCLQVDEDQHINNIAWHGKSPFLALGNDEIVQIWDHKKQELIKTINGGPSCAWHHEKPLVAIGKEDGTIEIWDVEKDECTKILKGHEGKIYSLNWEQGGAERLLSSAEDKTVRLWSENKPKIFKGHNAAVQVLAWPTGIFDDVFASGDGNGVIKVWDIAEDVCLKTLQEGYLSITSLVFSLGENPFRLVSSSRDTFAYIWDIRGEKPIAKIKVQNHDEHVPVTMTWGTDDVLTSVSKKCVVTKWLIACSNN